MVELNVKSIPLGQVDGLRQSGVEPVKPEQEGGQGPNFLSALERAIDSADADVKHSDGLNERCAAGEDVPVHKLMTAMAESDISLRLTSAVTTRAIAAYQEIARIQV